MLSHKSNVWLRLPSSRIANPLVWQEPWLTDKLLTVETACINILEASTHILQVHRPTQSTAVVWMWDRDTKIGTKTTTFGNLVFPYSLRHGTTQSGKKPSWSPPRNHPWKFHRLLSSFCAGKYSNRVSAILYQRPSLSIVGFDSGSAAPVGSSTVISLTWRNLPWGILLGIIACWNVVSSSMQGD